MVDFTINLTLLSCRRELRFPTRRDSEGTPPTGGIVFYLAVAIWRVRPLQKRCLFIFIIHPYYMCYRLLSINMHKHNLSDAVLVLNQISFVILIFVWYHDIERYCL